MTGQGSHILLATDLRHSTHVELLSSRATTDVDSPTEPKHRTRKW